MIFDATCRGVGFLPRSVSYAIGDAGTWLAWRLMGSTRKAVAENLQAIYEKESEASRQRRSLDTFRAYARDVVDFLRAVQAPEEDDELFTITPRDLARFNDLMNMRRGMILLSGHYGNWEIGSIVIRRVLKHPLTIMARAEASADANQRRKRIREQLGVDTIDVRKSLDTALQIRRQLSDNRIIAFLMDRHIERDRVAVTYLGRPAWFLRTPVLMGFMTGAPLLPTFIERTGIAKFNIYVGDPIFVDRELPRDVAIQRAAQQFADVLGERVRMYPQYWYQFFNYWESQKDPEGS